MGLNAVKMLGISITVSPKKEILEEVRKYLEKLSAVSCQLSAKQKKPLVIVTPNPEQVVLAQKDKRFARILNRADVAIPDGIGLVAAMRLLAQPSAVSRQPSAFKRISGVDLMEDLVAMAAERGYPIALIGGRAGVAVVALECLRQKYPGLVGWAMEPGEVEIGNLGHLGNLGEKIKETGVRLVFVGLGAPKQEFFIEALSRQLSAVRKKSSALSSQSSDSLKAERWKLKAPLVLMAVGGAFDMIAGRTPRAPLPMRTLGLEWLWRLIRQPWRFRRQRALLQFAWQVLQSAFKGLTL